MWVAFAKATHIFSAKILAYMPYLMIKILTIRYIVTDDIVSFEQLGPGVLNALKMIFILDDIV